MSAHSIPANMPATIMARMRRGRGQSASISPAAAAPDGAHVELALSTDVPCPHPEGDGGAEAGEEHRGGVHERGRESASVAEGRLVHLVVGGEGVVAGRQQHEAGDDRGEEDGHRRDGEGQPARRVDPAFDSDHDDAPAIISPTCSRVTSDGRTMPTTRPPYSTATRSERVEDLVEVLADQHHPDAARRRVEQGLANVLRGATSSPRVGEAATTTRGSEDSSRASSTLLHVPAGELPHQRVRTGSPHVEALHQHAGPCPRLLPADERAPAQIVAPVRLEDQVVGDRPVGRHAGPHAVLGDVGDALVDGGPGVPRREDVVADADRAAGRGPEAGDHLREFALTVAGDAGNTRGSRPGSMVRETWRRPSTPRSPSALTSSTTRAAPPVANLSSGATRLCSATS